MEKMLVVVDSDAKVAALREQLGNAPEVLVLPGPPLKVSLKPSGGRPGDKGSFSFAFTPLEVGKPLFDKLREYLGGAIYLALEFDQRGEFLCWLVSKALDMVDPGTSSVLRRLHPLALHREELRESFRRVEPIREQWAVGYHDRAAFDVALGKHLQRLLGTQVGPGGVPLTAASLAMIFLLAEREAEIRAHAPRPRQQITAMLHGRAADFPARLVYAYGITDDGDLYSVQEIGRAMRLLEGGGCTVQKVARTPMVVAPPTPYRLTELVEDAAVLHNISVERTMGTVRRLFDGVALGGEHLGLLTSFAAVDISPAVTVAKLRQEVARLAGSAAVRLEDEVATAEGFLMPTRPELDARALAGLLDEEGCLVYGLIRSRALASQMGPALGETVELAVKVGEHCYLQATSSTVSELGFMNIHQDRRQRELARPCPLAGLAEGDALEVVQVAAEKRGTAVSQLYTVDALFADLADFAIDAGPTALAILHLLIEQGYVAYSYTGELTCCDNARKVVSIFSRLFPTMPGISFSAYLEQTVAEVLSGRKPLDVALRQFDQTMIMKGNVLRKVAVPLSVQPRLQPRKSRSVIKGGGEEAAVPPPEIVAPEAPAVTPAAPGPAPAEAAAPEAGGGVVPPVAEGGTFESDAKAVPVTEPPGGEAPGPRPAVEAESAGEAGDAGALAETVPAAESVAVVPEETAGEEGAVIAEEVSSVDLALEGVAALEKAEPATVSEAESRQADEVFAEAGIDLPAVTPPPERPLAAEPGAEEGMVCPVCGKARILGKHTPAGKPFYVCPNADCEFMAWAPPHALSCQVCKSPFLVEKKDNHGYAFLRCPRAGCNYRQPLPGDDGARLLAEEQQPRKKVLVRRVVRKGDAAPAGKTRKVLVRRRK